MNAHMENPLPELDDERIAAMERTVFARIADDRSARSKRRGRWWVAGSAAAAVIVVAAVVAPVLTSSRVTNESFSAESVELAPAQPLDGSAMDAAVEGTAGGSAAVSVERDSMMDPSRETISTGSATLVVDDVPVAANAISQDVERRGGYVESVSVGASGSAAEYSDGTSLPAPSDAGQGWVSVRVPADDLTDVIGALDQYGEVTASTISAQDVTDQAIDLRARIAAAETSVARLTQLMAEAQSTADLIAAESALQERQATLDSDRQQLAWLEGQVAMATLSVQLIPAAAPASADPAGFGDGVVAGWNGLVATLNGLVIALGFLLPWIVVIAIAAAIAWGIVAAVRRSRRRRRALRDLDDRPAVD